MSKHLMNDETQWALLKPADPWVTVETKTEPYIVEQLNKIKLSWCQYTATSIIKYGSFIKNILALQNLSQKFYQQTVNVINSKPPAEILMRTNNAWIHHNSGHILWYIPPNQANYQTIQKFGNAWNHITEHLIKANATIFRRNIRIFSSIYDFFFGSSEC